MVTTRPAALTAAAAVLLALAGCTAAAEPPPQPRPAADTRPALHTTTTAGGQLDYLDALYQAGAGNGIEDLGNSAVLELGYAICDDLTAGWPPAEIVADLQQVDEPIGSVAGPLVTAARTHLCTVG